MRGIFGRWQAWALGSAIFAAPTAVFAKLGVSTIPSDLAALIRTVAILLLVAAIVIASGQWRPSGTIPAPHLGVPGAHGPRHGASWLRDFRALKLGEAARVAPIDKMSAVLAAVFGVPFLGERLSATNWAGMAPIAAGAVLVAWR